MHQVRGTILNLFSVIACLGAVSIFQAQRKPEFNIFDHPPFPFSERGRSPSSCPRCNPIRYDPFPDGEYFVVADWGGTVAREVS